MAANPGHVLGHALGRAAIDRPMLHAAVDASLAAFPRAHPPISPVLPPRAAYAADKAPFSIQTVGADAPGPTAAADNYADLDDFVVVTMTETTAVPTAAPEPEQGDAPPHDGPPDHERPPPPPGPRPPSAAADGECRLMGPFAIFVQLGLGALALLSLVFKRWRERPQRPVKVWFFDASKQVFGSALVHMSNVFLSLLTSGRFSVEAATAVATVARALRGRGPEDDGPGHGHGHDPYAPNPCSFYLLNLAIDTTVGIPILIGLLRLTTAIVAHTPLGQPPESIRSGHYGQPPRAWWWLKQSLLYFCGLLGMKVCVLIIFLACPWISQVGDWALGWTEGNEQVQIVFVMMLFPLIMNGLQYYIIDSYIKRQDGEPDHSDYDPLSESDREDGPHHHHSHHPRDDHGTDGDDESSGDLHDEDEELDDLDDLDDSFMGKQLPINSPTVVSPPAVPNPIRPVEYDPAVDGDSNTVISSSASQRQGSMTGKG